MSKKILTSVTSDNEMRDTIWNPPLSWKYEKHISLKLQNVQLYDSLKILKVFLVDSP